MKEGVTLESKWLTADEVAKQLNVSSMTIKRYVKDFNDFIEFKQEAKGKYYVNSNSLDVLMFICKLAKRAIRKNDIRVRLENKGFSKSLVIDYEDTAEPAIQKMVVVREDDLNNLTKQTTELINQNNQLYQRLDRIEGRITKQDEHFMQTIRAIQELKQIQIETAATTSPKKKWWKFW